MVTGFKFVKLTATQALGEGPLDPSISHRLESRIQGLGFASQGAQDGLIKGYALNHIMDPYII